MSSEREGKTTDIPGEIMINKSNGSRDLRSPQVRHPSKFRFSCLVTVFSLFLLIAGVTAQDTVTGAFQGDVSDYQTTNPLAGVAVKITSVDRGVVYDLQTDSQGRFFQGLLLPGFYRISVTLQNYKPQLLLREIKITITGDIIPVPVSLEPEVPGTTTPAVTVPDPPADVRVEINTADGRRDGSFREDEITRIPLGGTTVTRSFDELALLLPGVAPPPQTIGDVAGPGVGPGVGSSGQFAVNGLRSRANNFTVDGSDNNDEDIGVRRQGFVALVPQPIESIKEFQIQTLLAPAQFGRNIGAQVNAVSKGGGNDVHGAVYGFFNSSRLNARNRFDTANGSNTFGLRTTTGQSVMIDGNQPLTVRNQSGGEDTFTFGQGGGTLGGAIKREKLFYFLSGEYQKINASQEKSFAVPTVEQRGAFRTGATGISVDPFSATGTNLPPLFPLEIRSNAIFSLFPFANNPDGVYGANTFTRVLPASGRGTILSGRFDENFSIAGRKQSLTGRYNFTDDKKNIPAVNEALFSTVLSKIRTHNLSVFLNSDIGGSISGSRMFNQARFSFGRTNLKFDEVRDTEFLIPSNELPGTQFLLNARAIYNVSLGGQPRYSRAFPGTNLLFSTEGFTAPLGQVIISGFSPLGVDVYNFPQNRVNKTYQLADELTWRIGDHALAFGADLRRTDLNSDLPRLSRSLITFSGGPRLVPRVGNSCPIGGLGTLCFLPTGSAGAIIRPEDQAALGAASNALLNFSVDRPDSKANLRYYQTNFYAQDTWRINPGLSLSFGLRYEFNTPVKEVDGLIEQTFSDGRLAALPVLQRLIGGRTRLYDPDYNNFAPRLGIAYSGNLLGDNRVSVIRGGYGLFYDQILGAVANQSRNVFPSFLTINTAGFQDFAGQPLFIQSPANFSLNGIDIRRSGTVNNLNLAPIVNGFSSFEGFVRAVTGFLPNAVNVTLPSQKLDTPMAHHYSVSFEQQLSRGFTASAAYVGTTGRKLLRFTTPNLGSALFAVPTEIVATPGSNLLSATGNIFSPQRPLNFRNTAGALQTLGAVNQFETTASSTYNSLQAQLRGRLLGSFNMQLSYTFSKVTDDVSDVFDLAGAYVLPQNSGDLAAERGPANFDVRHRLAYDMIYSFKKNETNGLLGYLTDNLQIATTGRFRSGQPFTVNSVIDVNLDGNATDRLNTTQGIEVTGNRSQPLRLTTTNLGSLLAPFGQNGQIGRNTFRAGNVLELDVSVIKQFVFGSRSLAFRTDIFNFIDRANFGVPVRLLEAPGFGRATSTVTPGRRIQFSLKYEF